MATERRDIALSIIADTKRYQQELAKLPKMTDQAASQAAVLAIKQQIKEENEKARIRKKAIADRLREEKKADRDRTRSAERANREIEDSYRDQFSSIKGLSGAAFGGMAGDVFDLVEVVRGASTGMAAIGAGLAAIAIGAEILPRIVEHLGGLAEAGVEARDKIKDAGIELSDVFTAEQLQALSDYEQALKANELAMAAFAVETGAAATETGVMISKMGLMSEMAQNDAAPAVDTLTEGLKNAAIATVGQVASGKLLLAYLFDLGDRADEAADKMRLLQEEAAETEALEAHAEFVENIADAYEVLGLSYGPAVVETKKATKASKAQTEAAKMEAEALEDLAAGRNEQARQDRARYQEKIDQSSAAANAAIDDIKAEIEAEREREIFLAESAERHKKRVYEALLEEIRLNQEKKRLAAELRDSMLALQSTGLDVAVGFGELAIDKFGETATKAGDRADKLRGEIEQLREAMHDASEEERADIADTIEDKEDALTKAENRQKKANKAARQQFKSNQALQIANTIIAGSAAAIRAFAELGPIAGALAATAIGADTSLAVAKIKNQKPPKFHMGGMVEPDETPAILRRGEAVLSERATQRLGRRTIEALNRDEPLGSVNVYLGDDLLRSQRLTRAPRGGMHTAIGARSPYLGR
jgi:hypothetical protein